MESDSVPSLALERTMSQQSTTSLRSATLRVGGRKGRRILASQASSSRASSIARSDKSLTSFPSFSPETPSAERFGGRFDGDEDDRLGTATQERYRQVSGGRRDRGESIVDSLVGGTGRRGLFDDEPVPGNKIPGALHQADDAHIERLVSRHGAVDLVRQVAEDLAERDAQIATLRRKADERERALRRIIRECGLSNLDLETRLKAVEGEMRENTKTRSRVDSGLSDMMSDAMRDTMGGSAYGERATNGSTLRASELSAQKNDGKGTARGWKEFIWGPDAITKKKSSGASSTNGDPIATGSLVRSQSNVDRRPTLNDDLFKPPPPSASSGGLPKSSSRTSSIHSSNLSERKASGSLASMALRLVAGGAISTREQEARRGRAASSITGRGGSVRNPSASSTNTARSARAASTAGGPKALMAMRRATPVPQAQPTTKSQAQEMWETMVGSPPDSVGMRSASHGPVEMDAIRPPESQPPTLTHIYNNIPNGEYLTDQFGFIYDQRRKKRQREAAQMSKHVRKGSKTEMINNGRAGISPNVLEDLPSPKWSTFSDGQRPDSSASSFQENESPEEGKPKRWQDYLRIATVPTELLSHTPNVGTSSLEVLEAPESDFEQSEPVKTSSITPTNSGLVPTASTTTAVDNETPKAAEPEPLLVKEDAEPVRLLLQQLSDVHDSLQREKTPRWNDFLRKVRAERQKEGEAAIAAARSAAEARYERPAVILPETRVGDGEMIGIAGLGNKGKVGRNKWNEFKALILGGIPVAYRPKVWAECSGAQVMRVPGYYDDLVAQDGKNDDPTVVSQIKMDINRTLTDNIFFRKGPGVGKLEEVLVAYARRNDDVGYCQGMNLIAANLLLIMPSAEDAFWLLATIIENILPQGYYSHSLLPSRADQQVLRQYVSEVLPRLSAHLDSLSIELEALTFQWFLSVFTDCLCAEALYRVWDVVLCGAPGEGSTFLFQVALALLKLNEKNLLACQTPAGIYTYINHHMTEHAISIDGLMQASEGLRKLVKREDVELRREIAVQAEKGPGDEMKVAEPRPMEE